MNNRHDRSGRTPAARYGHTATVLTSGHVVIFGGMVRGCPGKHPSLLSFAPCRASASEPPVVHPLFTHPCLRTLHPHPVSGLQVRAAGGEAAEDEAAPRRFGWSAPSSDAWRLEDVSEGGGTWVDLGSGASGSTAVRPPPRGESRVPAKPPTRRRAAAHFRSWHIVAPPNLPMPQPTQPTQPTRSLLPTHRCNAPALIHSLPRGTRRLRRSARLRRARTRRRRSRRRLDVPQRPLVRAAAAGGARVCTVRFPAAAPPPSPRLPQLLLQTPPHTALPPLDAAPPPTLLACSARAGTLPASATRRSCCRSPPP